MLTTIRIFCGVDGSSICWDNRDLCPIDMGEHGKLIVSAISDYDEIWKSLLYQTLERIYLVSSETEKCVFALKFVFSDRLEVVITNLGDDLIFLKKLLPKIIEEEKAKFTDIQEIISEE